LTTTHAVKEITHPIAHSIFEVSQAMCLAIMIKGARRIIGIYSPCSDFISKEFIDLS
jgi:hypothetical protein